MFKQLRNLAPKFEVFLLFFILLQPFIDLFTSLSIFILNVDLTIGIFVRFGVMLLIVVYLFVKDIKSKKSILFYLIIFGLVLLVGLINNYMMKEPVSLFSEIKNIAKISYAPILLIGYLIAFRGLKERGILNDKVYKYIFYSMTVVSAVMVISSITGTGIKSYDSVKLGHQGWFFAGNEIGAIMAVTFGVVLLFSVKRTTTWQNSYFWIPSIMMIFGLLMLGTKVGYGAALIILTLGFFMNLLEFFLHKKVSEKRKPNTINLIISTLVLALFIVSTPYTPIANNMNVHLGWVGLDQDSETDENGQSNQEEELDETSPESIEKKQKEREALENVILSGRETFLSQHKQDFEEAPLTQKLFGMGYGGNYKADAKTVEMDFYDIFFSIGIMGFVLYIIPFVFLLIKILLAVLKNINHYFNREVVLIGASIVLGLGIGYTAGHLLTAPAVSIYLVLLIAYLYNRLDLKR